VSGFKELGSFLAVASDASLEIANDKTRTLEVAAKLDIDYPKSVQVRAVEDLSTGRGAVRLPLRAQGRRSRGLARWPTGWSPSR